MPKEENDKPEKPTEKPQQQEVDKTNESGTYSRPYAYRPARPFMIGGIIILIILFFVLIGSMFRFNQTRQGFFDNGNGGTYIYSNRQNMPHMNGSFFYSSTNSDGTTTSSTSVISGVVTAVNGSSFDVGGGGSKTTVNTNGSTTWNTTDKKVSVNDSVLVYGTLSGSTLTATSVQITN